MIIVCIVQISLMILYAFLMWAMKTIERKIVQSPCLKKYSKAEIEKIAADERLMLRYGKCYGYNPRKQEILVLEKKFYNAYDMFSIYHEIGHYHDDLKNKRILKNMLVTGVNRLFIIPISLVLTVLCWFQKESMTIHYICFAIIALAMLLGVHRLYFIIRYETSASKSAMQELSCMLNAVSWNLIKRVAYYAKVSQILFVVICIIAGGVMLDGVST